MSKLQEAVRHPWAQASTVVAALWGFLHFGALKALALAFWAKAGSVFTVASIFGFTIAPRSPAVPTGPATKLAVAAAGLYGLKKLYDVYKGVRST